MVELVLHSPQQTLSIVCSNIRSTLQQNLLSNFKVKHQLLKKVINLIVREAELSENAEDIKVETILLLPCQSGPPSSGFQRCECRSSDPLYLP
jgi:hypothetical protein